MPRGQDPNSAFFAARAAFEKDYLARALHEHGGCTATARALGISRKTLWEKMTKYGLSTPRRPTRHDREEAIP